MNKIFYYKTRIGRFYNAEHNWRFHPVFDGKSLGSYVSVKQAIEDLVGGHTFSISSGINTSELGIPDKLTQLKKTNVKK